MSGTWGEWRFATSKLDVLQLSKSSTRAIGHVDRSPSHAATSNSLLQQRASPFDLPPPTRPPSKLDLEPFEVHSKG